MEDICAFATNHGLWVIEDACQAHGARRFGRMAGTFGDVGCFSFHPSKNLGALGEAGAIITDNELLARRLRCLRDHGQLQKNHHCSFGWNARMDAIQAAILGTKLPFLELWNNNRRRLAGNYHSQFSSLAGEITLPRPLAHNEHVYHTFPIRLANRDNLQRSLSANGIETLIHYPLPCHLQAPYRHLAPKGSLPITEKSSRKILSLPIHPYLSADEQRSIIDSIHEACKYQLIA
jgi:dTDP-4-amino-4,6-dideoxygalactose transaminase